MLKLKNPISKLGKVTSLFGLRVHPITKKKSGHNGIDYAVPIGTKIIAPMDGAITLINTHATGGKQLVIKLVNGLALGFAHLSDNAIKNVGDSVKKGEVIALSGNTGASTGPHVHLTVTENGDKKNPLEYIDVDNNMKEGEEEEEISPKGKKKVL